MAIIEPDRAVFCCWITSIFDPDAIVESFPYLSGTTSNAAKTFRWYFGLKLLSEAMISV